MNLPTLSKRTYLIIAGVTVVACVAILSLILNRNNEVENPTLPAQVGELSGTNDSTTTSVNNEARGTTPDTEGNTDPSDGGELSPGETGDGEPNPSPQPSPQPSPSPEPEPEPEPSPEPEPEPEPNNTVLTRAPGEGDCGPAFGIECDGSETNVEFTANPANDPTPPEGCTSTDGTPIDCDPCFDPAGTIIPCDTPEPGDLDECFDPITGAPCPEEPEPGCGGEGQDPCNVSLGFPEGECMDAAGNPCPEEEPQCDPNNDENCCVLADGTNGDCPPEEEPVCLDAAGAPCPTPECDPLLENCGENVPNCVGNGCNPNQVDFCNPNTDPDCQQTPACVGEGCEPAQVDFCDPNTENCGNEFEPQCLGEGCEPPASECVNFVGEPVECKCIKFL